MSNYPRVLGAVFCLLLFLFILFPRRSGDSNGSTSLSKPLNTATSSSTTLQWRYFYIAVNLYNNEDVLPTFAATIKQFLERELLPALRHAIELQEGEHTLGENKKKQSVITLKDLAARIYFSVFSNGSTDRTAELIETLLVPILQGAGVVQMTVRSDGTACGGHAKRPHNMDRIKWMACIRNAAMQPLYDHGMSLFHNMGKEDPSSEDLAVLFFNDIFFKPRDVLRLLLTNGGSARDTAGVKKGGSGGGNFDMACGMDFYYSFYDRWVTRGVDGTAFSSFPPYANDRESQRMFASANALGAADRHFEMDVDGGAVINDETIVGIPVRCCWNGLAAIRGSLFVPPAAGSGIAPTVKSPANGSGNSTSSGSGSNAVIDVETAAAGPLLHSNPSGGLVFRNPETTQWNYSRSNCYDSECLLLCRDILELRHRPEKLKKMSKKKLLGAIDQDATSEGYDDQEPSASTNALVSTLPLVGGSSPTIFVNPYVKVAYEKRFFDLHHRHVLFSGGFFFSLMYWLRFWTWLFPSEAPSAASDPTWLECLLLEDTYTPGMLDSLLHPVGLISMLVVVVCLVLFLTRNAKGRLLVRSLRHIVRRAPSSPRKWDTAKGE